MSDDVPTATGRRPGDPHAPGPGTDATDPVAEARVLRFPDQQGPTDPDATVAEMEQLVRGMAVLTRAPRSPEDVLGCLVVAWPERFDVAAAALASVRPDGSPALAAQLGAHPLEDGRELERDHPLRAALDAERPRALPRRAEVVRRHPRYASRDTDSRSLVVARVLSGGVVTGAFLVGFDHDLGDADAAQAVRLARIASGLVALVR
jgi:hypothetical protein